MYVNCPEEASRGILLPRGTVLIKSTQIRWFSEQSGRRPRHLKPSKLNGDHQARVHPDQMVLMMVRQEAGPHERQPKMLK
jgi:hypothetical protein